jgi:hypothetical protein
MQSGYALLLQSLFDVLSLGFGTLCLSNPACRSEQYNLSKEKKGRRGEGQ